MSSGRLLSPELLRDQCVHGLVFIGASSMPAVHAEFYPNVHALSKLDEQDLFGVPTFDFRSPAPTCAPAICDKAVY